MSFQAENLAWLRFIERMLIFLPWNVIKSSKLSSKSYFRTYGLTRNSLHCSVSLFSICFDFIFSHLATNTKSPPSWGNRHLGSFYNVIVICSALSSHLSSVPPGICRQRPPLLFPLSLQPSAIYLQRRSPESTVDMPVLSLRPPVRYKISLFISAQQFIPSLISESTTVFIFLLTTILAR